MPKLRSKPGCGALPEISVLHQAQTIRAILRHGPAQDDAPHVPEIQRLREDCATRSPRG
jgi:hypothetical protein